MPRTKKQAILTTPLWNQTLKVMFLEAGFHHCPEALELLQPDVRAGAVSVHAWADQFSLAGTWVEHWAGVTLAEWAGHPHLFPNFQSLLFESAAADRFSYEVHGRYPTCKFALGTVVGGSLSEGAPHDDWERFKAELRNDLDRALENYLQEALTTGALQRITVPSELQLKVEVAALYFFRNLTPQQIADYPTKSYDRTHRNRTQINVWLKEVLPLLGLWMRAKGHRRRPESQSG
jgi:hypothetical protein